MEQKTKEKQRFFKKRARASWVEGWELKKGGWSPLRTMIWFIKFRDDLFSWINYRFFKRVCFCNCVLKKLITRNKSPDFWLNLQTLAESIDLRYVNSHESKDFSCSAFAERLSMPANALLEKLIKTWREISK